MKRFYLPVLFLVGALWPASFWTWLSIPERDFGSLWAGGRAILAGIDPYDLQALDLFADHLLGPANYNFTYPPHALFLFLPFSLLPPLPAFLLWDCVSVLFFWWAARPLMPKGLSPVWAVLTPAALINLNYGQTGLISAGLFLLAFRPSGLAAAALTFKPHLGLLVIPTLLRSRRAFTTAIIATALLGAASALAFGHWGAFIDHALGFQGKSMVDQSEGQWFWLGTTPGIGYGLWGWLLFAAGGAFFLARNFNVFTAATATFLIAPYGLHYDMAAVCLGFAIVLHARWDDMSMPDKVAASLAFLTPLLVVYATTWIVPPILLWGLAVQTRWTEGLRLTVRAATPRWRVEARAPAISD